MILGLFVEVCRRKGLSVNPDKSKMMVFGGEEELNITEKNKDSNRRVKRYFAGSK